MINHFPDSGGIGSKIGIWRGTNTLMWRTKVDPNTFFPICYYMLYDKEKENFKEEFIFNEALAILKRVNANISQIHTIGHEKIMDALYLCERRTIIDINEVIGPAISEV